MAKRGPRPKARAQRLRIESRIQRKIRNSARKPRLAGAKNYYPTAADFALYEKYKQQERSGEKPQRRHCCVCRTAFKPYRPNQLFCKTLKPECKWIWWNALHPRRAITGGIAA